MTKPENKRWAFGHHPAAEPEQVAEQVAETPEQASDEGVVIDGSDESVQNLFASLFGMPDPAQIDESHRRAAVHALNNTVGKLVDLVGFTASLVDATFVDKET